MYLLILYLSLISFIILIFFGKSLGKIGASFVTIVPIFFSNLLSLYFFFEVCICHSICLIDICSWINFSFFDIKYSFKYDVLSVFMLVIITSISFYAHFYSVNYMELDPHFTRFLAYLSLFTFFMIFLVISNNLIQLFFGWEGVGLCSYLLINFWFSRLQSNKAAMKALFLNKISDIAFLIGIFVIFFFFKSVNFDFIFVPISFYLYEHLIFFNFHYSIFFLISIFLLFAAVGKSAQIGLHLWLPDAMEGPTPVSSLIHAATMVTAGIFLLLRCSFLFEYSSLFSLLLLFIGSFTIFFASTVGFFQYDIKKIIAFSTCSQIGYMFFVSGYAGYSIAMFHLFTHAFFKALLFLAAGAVIHACSNEQDYRKMGGFSKLLPFSYIVFFIGIFSLMGFPFLTGYYSKDFIIELSKQLFNNFFIYFFYSTIIINSFYWFVSISIIFTIFYSLKLLFFIFYNSFNGYFIWLYALKDVSFFMLVSLLFLSIFSVFIGFFMFDSFFGLGNALWGNSIIFFCNLDYEFIFLYFKKLPLVLSLFGLCIYIFFFHFFYIKYIFQFHYILYYFFFLFLKRWHFDKIYNYISFFFFLFSFKFIYSFVDKGFLEYFGPFTLASFIYNKGYFVRAMQTHLIYHYLGIFFNFFFFLSIFFVFFYF